MGPWDDPHELPASLPSGTRGVCTAPHTHFPLQNGKKSQGKPVPGKMPALYAPAPCLHQLHTKDRALLGRACGEKSLEDARGPGTTDVWGLAVNAAQNSRVSQKQQVLMPPSPVTGQSGVFHCRGLNVNALPGLRCSNSWSPVSGTV